MSFASIVFLDNEIIKNWKLVGVFCPTFLAVQKCGNLLLGCKKSVSVTDRGGQALLKEHFGFFENIINAAACYPNKSAC